MPNASETVGGYALLQRIGGGGMGEVRLAEKITAGSVRRRAAVKRILPRYCTSVMNTYRQALATQAVNPPECR